MAVLYSTGDDPDWPDFLDVETGIFQYYGDNKRPGRAIHDTSRHGNELLRMSFDALHLGTLEDRLAVPPFFVFSRIGTGRDVQFRGLAAPGGIAISQDEDLVAIWRTVGGLRFQNYRATFTLLDVPTVPRKWLAALQDDQRLGPGCPPAWANWVNSGSYQRLQAPKTLSYRTKKQQLPSSKEGLRMLAEIHEHFRERPVDFERCADLLWRMFTPNVTSSELTRPTRDGGRDAIGRYSLGPAADPIHLTFALEAKCYAPSASVGVRETSRLISRIRHREFGVMVTTSYVQQQAYEEIRDDQHPIIVLAGGDLVDLLRSKGIATAKAVKAWLAKDFPPSTAGTLPNAPSSGSAEDLLLPRRLRRQGRRFLSS